MNEYKRWLARNDLWYLTLITGHDKIADHSFYRDFCDEVSLMNWEVVKIGIVSYSRGMLSVEEVVDDSKDLVLQRLYLCYRTFYKTTIITKVHSLQLLLNFPNLHIVLCHNKQDNASDNLVSIKNMFLQKPQYTDKIRQILKDDYHISSIKNVRELFPECVPPGKEWGNLTGFSLATRTDWGSRVEDNIEAVGVDTEVTGRHWDVAKKNDLVTEKSVTTEDQILKTYKWDERFNLGLFTDPQRPLQDYEGTRYHFADLYSVKRNDSNIKLTEIALIQDLEAFNKGDDSQITHPSRFTREGITGLMRDMWTFMCQMQQKPEDPAKMQFKPDMIQYFDVINKSCAFHLLVDPASKRKKKSDYTVMLVIGVVKIKDKTLKFIVDGIRDKLNPKERIDLAFELVERWKIPIIGWESIGFQDTDCYYFEEERRKRHIGVKLEEVKSSSVSKEDRIRGLVPEYSNKEWFWPAKGGVVKNTRFDGSKYDLTEKMEYEFLQFPLAEHDDLMDAMSFLNRISAQKPEDKAIVAAVDGLTFGEYAKLKDNKAKPRWANVERTSRV